MIQFNLLPNVKIEYLKTKRLKRMISLSAAGVTALCTIVLVSLFSVVILAQPNQLDNLDKNIKSTADKIKNTPDINKILTIQNQLTAIDALHEGKPRVENLFTYITQITPIAISVDTFNVDIEGSKIDVKGQAPSIEEMNKYIDTLKFTKIDYGDGSEPEKTAFSQVVLSSYSINEKGAGFSVTFKYDPDIFLSDKSKLTLVVPRITSTRSATERPSDLFKVNLTPTDDEENNAEEQ